MKTRLPLLFLWMAACLCGCSPSPLSGNDDPVKGSHAYTGEKISLADPEKAENSYSVSFIQIPGIGSYGKRSLQGFNCMGEIGFLFYDGGYCRCIDMEKECILSEFALPGEVCNPENHAGQADWGNEYAQAGDEFPVLYLSSYKEKCCYVLRMTRSDAELVQKIYLTDGTRSDGKYNLLDAQAFFPDGEKMVIKMGAVDPDGVKYKYWEVYDMPFLKFGKEVWLFSEKRNDRFYVRTVLGEKDGGGNYYNAGFAKDGKIYVLAGFKGNLSRLLVIGYGRHSVVTDIHWAEDAMLSAEQEQCCLWNGKLAVNYNGADYIAIVRFH